MTYPHCQLYIRASKQLVLTGPSSSGDLHSRCSQHQRNRASALSSDCASVLVLPVKSPRWRTLHTASLLSCLLSSHKALCSGAPALPGCSSETGRARSSTLPEQLSATAAGNGTALSTDRSAWRCGLLSQTTSNKPDRALQPGLQEPAAASPDWLALPATLWTILTPGRALHLVPDREGPASWLRKRCQDPGVCGSLLQGAAGARAL